VVTIVVGLGNPGRRYRGTRHNVGFLVLEELRSRFGNPGEAERPQYRLWRTEIEGRDVMMAEPQLYMNKSGVAVRTLLEAEGRSAGDMLVVCDDFHLEFGALRLRRLGSHGGHNGLRSLIDVLRTREFARLRVGIGPAPEGVDHAEFVLEKFEESQRRALPEVVGEAADCVAMALRSGIEPAMNRFNGRAVSPAQAGDQAAD
jgi:peptidyl-tRNA hydrolase, PTH1 family